jgi:hypothetical protein
MHPAGNVGSTSYTNRAPDTKRQRFMAKSLSFQPARRQPNTPKHPAGNSTFLRPGQRRKRHFHITDHTLHKAIKPSLHAVLCQLAVAPWACWLVVCMRVPCACSTSTPLTCLHLHLQGPRGSTQGALGCQPAGLWPSSPTPTRQEGCATQHVAPPVSMWPQHTSWQRGNCKLGLRCYNQHGSKY